MTVKTSKYRLLGRINVVCDCGQKWGMGHLLSASPWQETSVCPECGKTVLVIMDRDSATVDGTEYAYEEAA